MLLALGKSYQQLHQVCCDHFYQTITLISYTYKIVDRKNVMNSNIFVDKKIDVHEGERIRLIVTANAYIRKCVWIHTGR